MEMILDKKHMRLSRLFRFIQIVRTMLMTLRACQNPQGCWSLGCCCESRVLLRALTHSVSWLLHSIGDCVGIVRHHQLLSFAIWLTKIEQSTARTCHIWQKLASELAKLARLRQAKEEAEREIAEYRAQMEAEFERKVAESSGDSVANVKRLEQETNTKIEQPKQQAANVSPDVIQMLLWHVTTVKN